MSGARRDLGLLAASVGCVGLLPLLPGDWIGNWHDAARVLESWVLVLAIPVLAAVIQDQAATYRSVLVAGLSLAFLACAAAPFPAVALRETLLLAGLGCVALSFAHVGRVPDARELLVKGVAIAAGAYALVELVLALLAILVGIPLNNASLFFGYDNPRFLNHAQVVYMPLLAGIAIHRAVGARWRVMAGMALAANVAFLLFSVGRSAALALACVTLLGLAFGVQGRRWSAAMAGAAGAGIVLYLLLFRFLPAQADAAVNDALHAGSSMTSDHSRLYLWRIALNDIASSPWIGIGPMHFAHYPNRSGAHPHNFYLQVAAEFGLPFACLLFGILGRALFLRLKALRCEAASTDPLVFGAVMACCGAAIDALSSGNMVMPISQLWIAIAAGLAMSRTPIRNEETPAAPPVWRWLGGLLVVVYLVFAVDTTMTWIGKRRAAVAESISMEKAVTPQTLRPRFWLDGWF